MIDASVWVYCDDSLNAGNNMIPDLSWLSRLKGYMSKWSPTIHLAQMEKIRKLEEELSEKNQKIHSLESNIDELQGRLNAKEDVEFRDNAYWKKLSGDGPFCVPCWDKDNRLSRMVGKLKPLCSICKYYFKSPELLERERIEADRIERKSDPGYRGW